MLPTMIEATLGEARARPTVLLVDNDSTVRGIVYAYLERGGYDVLAAGSGVDALTICRQFRHEITLLLTDVQMPGMSGIELAENVARLRPLTRVLFMSGDANEKSTRDSNRTLLLKPFNGARLMEGIKHALRTQAIGKDRS
jgi:CheY-like chemotaxis protein